LRNGKPAYRSIQKTPGIGAKSAQRLAFFILKMDSEDAGQIAEAILEVKRSIRCCSVCNNLTDVDPCQYCSLPTRSDKTLCIVEESTNILSVEKTHAFNGRYHVLMGSLSSAEGNHTRSADHHFPATPTRKRLWLKK